MKKTNRENDHNAFYKSKRFYYETSLIFHSPEEKTKAAEWCILQKITHIWFGILLIIINCFSLHQGIKRYLRFKTLANDPSFGFEWNVQIPLSIQSGVLIISASLMPILIFTLFCKNGHPVNDGFALGKQMIHTIQKPGSNLAYNSNENLKNSIDDLEAGKGATAKPDQDYTMKKRCFWFRTNLKPVSISIQVIITVLLIYPLQILHAEMIKNETLAPEVVWHSDLDIIFGIYRSFNSEEELNSLIEKSQIPIPNLLDFSHFSSALRNHNYPERIADVSIEFFNLCLSLAIFILKYSTPFWFTSRAYTFIISLFLLPAALLIISNISTMAVLYKVTQIGIIVPGGMRVDNFKDSDIIITPILCTIFDLIGNLSLIICVVCIYDFGEGLYEKAHVNYLNLLSYNQIGKQTNSDQINCDVDPYRVSLNNEEVINEPSLISVTTKYWLPDLVQRRQRRLRDQYLSDLKSTSGTVASNQIYLNHTLDETIKSSSLQPAIRSCLWPMVFGFGSLFVFIAMRCVLIHPYLKYYRETRSKLFLFHLIYTIIFSVFLIILWVSLSLKTAWRFRLIHVEQTANSVTTCTPLSTLPSNLPTNTLNENRQYSRFNDEPVKNNHAFMNDEKAMNSYVLVKPDELNEKGLNQNLRVNPIIVNDYMTRSNYKHSPAVKTDSSYESPRQLRRPIIQQWQNEENNNPYASLNSLQPPNQKATNPNENMTIEDRYITRFKIHSSNSPLMSSERVRPKTNILDETIVVGDIGPMEPFSSFREGPMNAYQSSDNYTVVPLGREKMLSHDQLCSQV